MCRAYNDLKLFPIWILAPYYGLWHRNCLNLKSHLICIIHTHTHQTFCFVHFRTEKTWISRESLHPLCLGLSRYLSLSLPLFLYSSLCFYHEFFHCFCEKFFLKTGILHQHIEYTHLVHSNAYDNFCLIQWSCKVNFRTGTKCFVGSRKTFSRFR